MALRLRGATSGYIELKAPASAGDNTLTLPVNNGSANQLLKTDGSGNLSWTDDNSGVSLSGSTNNTIATVTGANALIGEANLTFDGNNLAINGSPPWSVAGGDYRNLSISGQIANSGGFLWLGNGTATTNGDFDLGRINFCNGATITSQIAGSTQTSANDDGRISFWTKATGASLTEKLRILSNGDIGVGIAVPTTQSGRILHLHAGAAQQRLHMTNDTTGSSATDGFEIIVEQSANTRIRNFEAGDMAFDTGGSSNEVMRINSGGSLLIGATAVENWDSSRSHYLQITGATYATAGMSILDTQNDDNPCEIVLGKSRSTGNTIVGSADDVGQMRWCANDGNGFHTIAHIRCSMNGAPASDNLPSKLRFGTCLDNTVTVSDRLVINNRGSIENQTMSQSNTDSWTTTGLQSFMRTSPRSIQFTLNKTWSLAADGMKSGIIFKLDGSTGDNVTITVEGAFNWSSSSTGGGYYKAKWTMNQQYNGITWRLIEQTNSHPYNCGITAVQSGVDSGTTHIGWFSGSTSGSAGFEIKYPVITIEGEGYDSVSYKVEDKNDTLTKKYGRRNENDYAHIWEIETNERERVSSGHHYFGTTAAVGTSQRGVSISNATSGNPVLVETSSSQYTGGAYSHYAFHSDTHQCGTINVDDNTTTYNTSSDYRLKENQVSISDGITRVKQLKPYKFNFKTKPDRTIDGFFAHEVQSVVPISVSGTKDEMKSLYYEEEDTIPDGKEVGDFKEFSTTEINPQSIDHSKLVPLLTAALKEAIAKIETLETKVAALESA